MYNFILFEVLDCYFFMIGYGYSVLGCVNNKDNGWIVFLKLRGKILFGVLIMDFYFEIESYGDDIFCFKVLFY